MDRKFLDRSIDPHQPPWYIIDNYVSAENSRMPRKIPEKLRISQNRLRFLRKRPENFVSLGFKYPLGLILVCVKERKKEENLNESQTIMLRFDNNDDA
jgi:hypothetical protein